MAASRAARWAPSVGRTLDELLVDQHVEGGDRHRAGERVAAVGRAVDAGREDVHHLVPREERGDGVEAAGERLADGDAVGPDALVLEREQLAGAAEAGLDLVEDQQHAVLVADLPQAPCR